MSKGKYTKRRPSKVNKNYAVIVIVLAAILALLLMGLMLLRHMDDRGQDNTVPTQTAPTVNTEKNDPEQTGTEPIPSTSENTQPPETVPQRVEGDYEQWLAAGMVLAVSMEYPDFEIRGVYIASKTAQHQKMLSDGAYILILSGGEEILIQSLPLDAERTEAGTRDLYTMDLGFATFDSVAVDSVDLDAMIRLELEDLEEMIRQTMLPSVYSR